VSDDGFAIIDQPDLLICLPWADRVPAVPSVAATCVDCDTIVAVSRSIRKEQPEAVAICFPCVVKRDPDAVGEVSPAARREIAAHTGRDPGTPAVSVKDMLKRMQRR
jgi:hypothetical protein